MKSKKIIYVMLLINAVTMYVLPFVLKQDGYVVLMQLLLYVPGVIFLTSVYLGMKNKFSISYIILVGMLAVPSILLFYKTTELILVVVYCLIALIGKVLGRGFAVTN